MIIKNITQIGNPLLRRKSKLIKNFKSSLIRQTIKDLSDTLKYQELIGISAPQIEKSLRIMLTQVRATTLRKGTKIKKDPLRVYINPNIIWYSKNQTVGYEGCGSVAYAQFFAQVKRSQKCIVEAWDEQRNRFQLKAEGLLARVIQHEYDHLQGILFTDKIHDAKSIMSREEYVNKIKIKN